MDVARIKLITPRDKSFGIYTGTGIQSRTGVVTVPDEEVQEL
jgi:hypothetical protein